MNQAERIAAATDLLHTPIFIEFWAEMEKAAIDACLAAKPTDHEARAAYAAEARAIRNFRFKLNAILGEVTEKRMSAPA